MQPREPEFGGPNYLFHFTSASAAFGSILKPSSCVLRMSAYRRMRDPFEAKGWPIDFERPLGWTGPGAWHALRYDHDRPARGRVKLLSLSEDGALREDFFNHALYRASMWERYASESTGVCLIFDRGELCRLMLSLSTPAVRLESGSVVYLDKWPVAQKVDLREEAPPFDDAYRRKMPKEIFLRKFADWQSESEFRFICFDGTAHDYLRTPNLISALRAVVIGHRFASWSIRGAVAALKGVLGPLSEHQIALRFMQWEYAPEISEMPIVTSYTGAFRDDVGFALPAGLIDDFRGAE